MSNQGPLRQTMHGLQQRIVPEPMQLPSRPTTYRTSLPGFRAGLPCYTVPFLVGLRRALGPLGGTGWAGVLH